MKKVLIAIALIGISILALKCGDIILTVTNKSYRTGKQVETWNARVEDTDQKIEEISSKEMLLTRSGNIEPATNIFIEGIKFTVVINSVGDTTHWSVRDTAFKTPEGYAVGTKWEHLPPELQQSTYYEPGWGYSVKLASGWQLGFCEGQSCTDFPPGEGSKASWFFKREK